MSFDLPVIAGTLSTFIFFFGTFPMLHKAVTTRNLASYSKEMLVANTVANIIHAVYIFSLPAGPIWVLHTFYLVTTALMLYWYMRYAERPGRPEDGTSQSKLLITGGCDVMMAGLGAGYRNNRRPRPHPRSSGERSPRPRRMPSPARRLPSARRWGGCYGRRSGSGYRSRSPR